MWAGIQAQCGLGSGLSEHLDQGSIWTWIRAQCGLGPEFSVGWDQGSVWTGTRAQCGLGSGLSVDWDQAQCGAESRVSGMVSERWSDLVMVTQLMVGMLVETPSV